MKAIIFLISALFIAVSAQAKIGYVDSQLLSSELSDAKTVKQKAQAIEKEFKDKKERLVNEYKDLSDKYQTSKLILTEAKRQELLRQIAQKEQAIAAFDQQNSPVFSQRVQDLMAPFQAKLRTAIEEVRKMKKLDIVFDKQVTIAVNESLDITKDVKNYLEKKKKKK